LVLKMVMMLLLASMAVEQQDQGLIQQ